MLNDPNTPPMDKLPDYSEFMEELNDPEKAKDFLLHIAGAAGYVLPEVPEGTDIRDLEKEFSVNLAKMYWGLYFLDEYPYYGKLEN